VPAELLRLSGRALAEHDVDEGRAAVGSSPQRGRLEVLRVLNKKALGAKGFHHLDLASHAPRASTLLDRGFEPGRLLISFGVLAENEQAGQQKHQRNRDQRRQRIGKH
jgi:hypothetical protein